MRYIVTGPVTGGSQWWNVADTQSDVMPNFEVASFFARMPHAEHEARSLAERLNARESAA